MFAKIKKNKKIQRDSNLETPCTMFYTIIPRLDHILVLILNKTRSRYVNLNDIK